MKYLQLFLFFFLSLFTQAQDCDCEKNFNWLKTTFEENDAGFAYALEQKGEQAYEKHNEVMLEKVKGIQNSVECTQTLFQWLRFFRSGHIAIRRINNSNAQNTAEAPSNESIIQQFKDWETHKVDLNSFERMLQKKKKADFEGIWESPPYKIGIKKEGEQYIGFIIEADGVYWRKDQIKLKITKENDQWVSTFYMRDHSPRELKNVEILGNNFLQMDFVTLKRLDTKFETEKSIERYFDLISSSKPLIKSLSDQTLLLRIPSFSRSEKKDIDNLIAANKEKILSTENLIIDLRNNGGGSDASYHEILQFLYTNPIRTVGVELLSTELNNQRMIDFTNDPNWSEEDKKWAQESYDKLSKHLGEFVDLDDEIVNIETFDQIHPYPKNVGVIIHENNGSTTEQFLLAAKQSKKVKLFGTTTVGVLDISNMYFVNSPCNEFQLGYSLSRSMRIPDMTIDDKGIQPDYYIDRSVPKYGWVDFVEKVLTNN